MTEQGRPATSDPTGSSVRSSRPADVIWAKKEKQKTARKWQIERQKPKKKKKKKKTLCISNPFTGDQIELKAKRINNYEMMNPRPVLGWSLRKTVCDSEQSTSGTAGPTPVPTDTADDGEKEEEGPQQRDRPPRTSW